MCGLVGILATKDGAIDLRRCTAAMTATLHHRGPDDHGTWVHERARIALGHRRLSIQDLSPLGHQPMVSRSGRYTIVFNGEIYNFRILRAELERHGESFRGHSDTEVLLAGFERWGFEPTLRRAAGMFALGMWDEERRSVLLARDRMGEKPLYVARIGEAVLFASELRAFSVVPGFRPEVDPDAIAALFKLGYIPAPQTIYNNAYKLSPGALLELRSPLDLDQAVARGRNQLFGVSPVLGERYWKLEDVALAGTARKISSDEAVETIDKALRNIVREQLVADVPVGAFLSGGVDSSVVVAALQAESSQPIRTFTIAFPGSAFDESPYAQAVAQHLGTHHQSIDADTRDLVQIAPRLGAIYDEPFADSSQIATVLVSRVARQHVTVCLSGDGGDELFSGYGRYEWMRSASAWLPAVPRPLRNGAAALLGGSARHAPDWALNALLAAGGITRLNVRERFHRIAETLRAADLPAVYERLISYWQRPADAVVGSGDPPQMALIRAAQDATDPWIGSMLWDQLVYLPGDNLTKVDRASMSVGLETRLPLLDHRLVETAWGLGLKDAPGILGRRKALLKKVLYRYVPPNLIDRPKMGFTVPLAAWLRGPLREWAGDTLHGSSAVADFFDNKVVEATWRDHQAGVRDHHMKLWPVLMLIDWAHTHISAERATARASAESLASAASDAGLHAAPTSNR